MKSIFDLKKLALILLAGAFIYLLGAFVAVDMNPHNWNEVGRLSCVIIYIIITFLIIMQIED